MEKLTKEQAESLIEKIKTEALNEFNGGNLTYAKVVEKVIRQHATFPPEEGYIAYSIYNGELSLKVSDYYNNEATLQIKDGFDHLIFNIEGLTELRDNINLMLEYLKND